MIKNTKTADWAIHIATIQAAVGALYRAHATSLSAADQKALSNAVAGEAKAAINDASLFLSNMHNKPQAHALAKELLDSADRIIAADLAEIAGTPPAKP